MLDHSLSNTQQPVGPSRRSGGFTLLELLVVVAIIGALAAIAIPAYHGYVDKAKRTVAISTMQIIRKTFESFIIDNREYPEPPINFTTGRDNQSREVFSSSLLEDINNDLFSIDSYTRVGENYTVTATAKDSKHTVLTMTPQTLNY